MKNPLKIVYMINDLCLGGAERLLVDLITELNKSNHKIFLITLNHKGELYKELPENVQVLTTINPLKILTFLKKNKPDIFHSHLWRSDFLGIPLAKAAGIKKIFSTKHNVNYFRGVKKILSPIDALILKQTSTVVTISDAVKKYYLSSGLYKNIDFKTIYNGINLEPYLKIKKTNKMQEPFYFLTVANLIPQKGHLQFLDIISQIDDIDWQWHLVGDGPEKENIMKKINDLGLNEKVILHGKQVNTLTFYQQADLFILPSLWEGFGLVLLEAIASKTPVFAADVDGVNEILKNAKSGQMFSWQDEEINIIKLLPKAITSEFVFQSKMIVNQFSISTMAEEYLNHYYN